MIVLLFSVSAIAASDLNNSVNVDVLKDVPVNKGTYSDFYYDSFNESENFNLEKDYIFNNQSDSAFVGGIGISKKNFVINGNGHTIDCNNQARALKFNETGTINNLIIKNVVHEKVSAILSYSTLTLNNVTFINCSWNEKNSGAVYVDETTLNINNCKFIDNAGGEGASITALDSSVNIDKSTFESNSDKIIKGQIYLYNTNTTITESDFSNTVSKYATAIFAEGEGNLNISKSKFKNLHANKTAGAIAAKLLDSLIISQCEFDNISSEKNGGAIYADINGNSKDGIGFVKITSCSFNKCYSEFGGAVLQLAGNLTISNSNFTSNKAEYDGGAIYTSFADVEIINSKFISNTLVDDVSYGGAGYFDKGNITIRENIFKDNVGLNVSTIYGYDSNLNLQNNYFNNPSNVTSIYTVFGKVICDDKNNFTNDRLSFNNTNYNYNFENTAKELILLNNSLSFDELPEKFDLRQYGWVTPVKDQGFIGSCWAFASLAALESALLRYANVTYSLSANNMQNSMLQYSKYGILRTVEGSTTFAAQTYLVDWLGIFPEEYDGYDELGKISPLYITPEDIHVQNTVVIPARKGPEDNDLIKNALIKYGAVATSHNSDFDKNKYFNTSNSAQYYYGKQGAIHAVCIVGWDDNYSKYNFLNTPPKDGAWIVKNSWGSNWGDGGYFYASYYDTSIAYSYNAAFIINNDTYDRIYQYDLGGTYSTLHYADTYANIYTAEKDELIAAVGTFFEKNATKYQFTISVNDIDVHTQKGISNVEGYETIKLTKLVQIKKGDVFRVTFESYKTPTVLNLRIHPQFGKSLVSEDNEVWNDLANINSVAILKAYTVCDMNITDNLVKFYGNDTPFIARAGAGEDVIFEINNKTYTVKADEKGVAKLEIDFSPGRYVITTNYRNTSLVNYIIIKNSTIISSNAQKMYNDNYDYKLQVLDNAGKPLNNTKVEISINGKPANYTSDSSGNITINFKKLTASQIITVKNPVSGEIKTTNIKVLSRFSGASNVVMYYFDGSKFKSRIVGDDGKFVGKNQAVTIKLNKKTYSIKTDANGYVTLKIPNTVKPGTYKLTATYKGQTISKTVKVKQNLKTSKYTVKKTSKKLTVKATLKNGKNALKGKKVTLKVNGKTFKATTNKKGIAQFTLNKNVIKKLKAGKTYTMKVTYLKHTVKTTLKVKH